MPKKTPPPRFVLRRVRRERKAVGRTDSKQWRRLQSGLNSDTRHPASLLGSTERLQQVEVEGKGKEEVKGRRGEEEVDNIIRKILEQQTHLRSHLDRLERTRRGGGSAGRKEVKVERELGGKVVVPEVEEDVGERVVGGQGGKEKGCSYLMKTFLNSTVESSEDFCRCAAFPSSVLSNPSFSCSHDSGIGSALAGKSESSIAQNTEVIFCSPLLLCLNSFSSD